MRIIDWSKKNYLIIILFIVAVLMWWLKIKTNNQNSDINSNISTITPIIDNKTDDFISVKPTVSDKKIFGNKTKEEILQLEAEEKYEFITKLSREEVEELDMMPNYDFSDFLPKRKETFIAEKYSSKERILTVKGLIEDKNKILEEVNSWLFYETGNNPRTIKIIWNQ